MKSILFITTIILATISCSTGENNNKDQDSQEPIDESEIIVEDFDVFFTKFCSDSVFQFARIVFPLTVEAYDIDSDKFDTSNLDITEWDFVDFKKIDSSYIVELNKTDTNSVVNIQIAETGVSVNYIFEIQKSKWTLVKIIDEST